MKMTTKLPFISLLFVISTTVSAQTAYNYARLKGERLDRGVVAFRTTADSVCIQWRYLPTDPQDITFDVLRDGKVIGHTSATAATFFMDANPAASATVYEVKPSRSTSLNLPSSTGTWTLPANAPIGYLDIPLTPPVAASEGSAAAPEGSHRGVSYNANDATMADLDGDGQMEIILKWDPSNSRDNSQSGITSPTILEALRLDGTSMWRVNLGPNIRSGAHYTPFIVADLDGDGCAELLVRTSDGTIDGTGAVLGDPAANHVRQPDTLAYQANGNPREQFRGPGWPNNMDRKAARGGFVYKGPEWVTCFDGKTGRALSTVDYIPARGNLRDWGDNYANRSDRFLAGCAYLDGEHLSALFCRGYYTRTGIAAYDFDGKGLSVRWVFDTNTPEWRSYAGQGNHNLRIGDVDGDGCDEITYGSMAVDHDGRGLYNTGFGHGDAMHLTAFSLDAGLQLWDCHENKRDGSDFRDARTGKVLFQILSNKDVGRCMAADIDPNNPGLEMWSSASGGVCNVRGEVIDSTARIPINFGIWWDGDLLRELLDHERVSKYIPLPNVSRQGGEGSEETLTGTPYDFSGSKSCVTLMKMDECAFNNGTKSNEEVLTRTKDNRHLRLYITPIPTKYRFHTFLSDPVYRHSLVMQNVGYNQPTNVGFFFGADLEGSGRLFRGWQF